MKSLVLLVSLLNVSLPVLAAPPSSVPVECRAWIITNLPNGQRERADGAEEVMKFDLVKKDNEAPDFREKNQKVLLRGRDMLVTITDSLNSDQELVINVFRAAPEQTVSKKARQPKEIKDLTDFHDLYDFNRVYFASGEGKVKTGSNEKTVGKDDFIVNCSIK